MISQPATPGLEVDKILERATQAAAAFRRLNQEETDNIVKSVAAAAFNARVELARMAVEETGLGKWEDKVIKNVLASKVVYEDIKDIPTAGVVAVEKEAGIIEIAEPVGPIVALTPITNPTSTVIFKVLTALKTRNPIIIRPHGAARRCSCEAARICYEAAVAAGAPENCVQWVKFSTREEVTNLMAHPKTALVMATGSVDVVRGATSSGKPVIGVGPGNVPVVVDSTADLEAAAKAIAASKTFDYGTVCASEQAAVVLERVAEPFCQELRSQGAYFLSKEEIRRLEPVAFNSREGLMRVEVIGQPATKIASLAGIEVPENTTVLVAPLDKVGPEAPLSLEILAPILALFVAKDENQAFDLAKKILQHGGLGHTASIFSQNPAQIARFAREMPVGRVLINTPASLGALGGIYNLLRPSLVLACGQAAGNSFMDNISVYHLFNRKKVAEPRPTAWMKQEWQSLYLDETISWEKFASKSEGALPGEKSPVK